ncbi:MAG: glycosyltransferase family 117 protein [Candidatus Limnocylindria bacterium]
MTLRAAAEPPAGVVRGRGVVIPAGAATRIRRGRAAVLPYADGLLSWAAAAVAVAAIGLYLRTMLPGLGLWDIGEAQTVPHTLSIFHPTGFPTYTMLGWLWSQLPVGDVAWRMNLFSGVCLALSSGLVALITGHLIDERHRGLRAAAAAIAGAAFAVSAQAWGVAVHADVHALNTLFEALVIWLLLCWAAAERRRTAHAGRWLLAAALTFGIGLGNHPLLGLTAFGIAAWLVIVDPRIWRRRRLLLGCAGLLVLGLGTYLYIPVRALIPPEPPLFYARPTTLDRMRYLVFAEQFRNLFQFDDVLGTLPDKWPNAADVLQRQLLGPGWVLAAMGTATLAVRCLGALVFLGLIVVADVVYAMNFSDGDIGRYYLPTMLVGSALVGVAVALVAAACARAVAEISRRFTGLRGRRRLASLAGALVLGIGLLLPLSTVAANYDASDQSSRHDADRWVASVYAALPPDAVIVSWWSYSTPLWYHRWILGQREDVTIIDERNILDDGYGTIDRAIDRYLGRRPVYVVPAEWNRDQILATYETESIPTIPGYSAVLRIKEPPPP